MKTIRQTLLASICLFSALSNAGEVEGTVIKIATDRIYNPPKVFILIAGNKSNIPTCQTNTNWSFALPLDTEQDKAIFSLLLSAHATGKTALLEGRGACDVHSSIETLSYVEY